MWRQDVFDICRTVNIFMQVRVSWKRKKQFHRKLFDRYTYDKRQELDISSNYEE